MVTKLLRSDWVAIYEKGQRFHFLYWFYQLYDH